VKKRICAAVVGLVVIADLAPHLRAVDLRDVLADYTLTSWSRKDGLTGPVWAIAQDKDGFLWLGSDEGLMRFDGVRFAPWDTLGGESLPQAPIRALHVSRDGSLWAGLGGTGGIARIQHNTLRVYHTATRAIGVITAITEDRARTMWAAGNTGLFRLNDDRWERLGPEQGLPDGPAISVYVDSSGTLWVSTAIGLFWRPEATEERFQQIETSVDPLRALSLSEDSTGRIWTSDPLVGFRTLGDRGAPPIGAEAGRGYRLVHDREGNLWVATIGQGLWRVRHTDNPLRPIIEKTTVFSGLSSDAVRSVFEDRDGNIWGGTTEGIDRLVPHRVTPWTGLGLVGTIEATADNHVWAGTAEGLIRFTRTSGVWQPDATRIPMRGVRVIRAGVRGPAWISSSEGLFRLDGTHASRVALPQGTTVVEAIASDRQGGVWAIAQDGVILRGGGSRMESAGRVADLANVRITAATADGDGNVWVAYSGSRVGVFDKSGQFHSYGPQDGLGAGPHYAFHQDRRGVLWVCGVDGLTRFAHGQFVSITRANGLPAGGIFALTEDEEQNLWLATSAGVLRLAPGEIDSAIANRQYQMRYRVYDTSDGLAGFPAALGDPNAVRAGDGTLWFVTSRGLSVVQPHALAVVRTTPKIAIDRVEADDRVVPVTGLRSLPPGTKKLAIDYTAPDLTYALKTRFRYRLEGFDADWIDAGTRRQARYADLPPRLYRFRVQLSKDEGGWTDSNEVWDLAIAPRAYQTWWFYALCAVAAAALLWGAWQLRLRQLRRQFSLVLGERVRVSRELHDTLLQSLVGVALEFDAVAKSLESSPSTARERVITIREHVEEYIREARRSIWSLRSPALETRDLVEALREHGERATSGQPVAFQFSVTGTPLRQGANLEHQVLRIGQEAVLNAVRHAAAHVVTMDLQFDPDSVILRVTDDGKGFDPSRTSEGTTDHYGILTMRERAEQVGGHVTITSAPARGTVVEAIVPTSAPAEDR
jgi:signal transduction histidine kinase/ligand-binding sensor domain-containing protein